MRITVVGAGALGASAALALADSGHEVTLLERGTLASGATSKAAGILSTFCWSDTDAKLIAETRGMVGELIAPAMASGCREAKGAWRSHPSIVVARGEGRKALDEMQARVERLGEEPERFEARQAAREFPGLIFEPNEEVLVAQEDGVLDAGDLGAALRARLEMEGVTLRENQRVASLKVPGSDAVVVAGGAWTKGLLAAEGLRIPVLAYRTQLASLQMPGGGGLPIVHDLAQHFYTRPESDDSILAGNGTQLRPFDPDDYNEKADPEFIESIAERVVARFGDGAEAQVRTGWAGLCAGTPDRRPLCGPVPGRDGLFVLTGDNGFGLMRSLALGSRLADAVRGRIDPALDPSRFGPDPPEQFELREGYGAPGSDSPGA